MDGLICTRQNNDSSKLSLFLNNDIQNKQISFKKINP